MVKPLEEAFRSPLLINFSKGATYNSNADRDQACYEKVDGSHTFISDGFGNLRLYSFPPLEIHE